MTVRPKPRPRSGLDGSRPLRVLVLSHMFPRGPEDWGGIFVHEQVRALREAEVDARVVAGNFTILTGRQAVHWRTYRPLWARPHAEWMDVGGVPTLYFPFLTPYAPWWGRVGAFSYRRSVRRWVGPLRVGFPFDLVHAHTAFLDGTAGAWLARQFAVPLVLTEHTGPFSALTAQPVMRWQTARAINAADALIVVSEVLRQQIVTQVPVQNPDRIQILGNGVDVRLFHPGGPGPPADGTIRGLWVGGFLPVKQPLMLIDAFAAALAREPRLRLSMLGMGVLETAIRERIRSHGIDQAVFVLPSAPRAVVADQMRRHHFLVISSESETFGLVAVEALACGRPVLSTRCGGPEETVGGRERGEFVPNSAEGLTDGFLRMAGRMGEFDSMALHVYVARNYGLESVAKRLQAVYAHVVAPAGSDT